MKVDFHAHTQKCKSGDSPKRKISPENFSKKMSDNHVVMCAITNHNKFDKTEFDTILSFDHNFTIFPGIELDVKLDENKHYHTILICDPIEAQKFNDTFDNEPDRNYDDFFLSYTDFIHKIKSFSNDKIIVIPHFLDKDKKRAFSFEDKEQLINDLSEYIVILEPGKINTMGIINGHDELSLLGSDVQNWAEYNSYELPEIKFRIDSFGKFYELAKDPKLFVKSELSHAEKSEIGVDENNDDLVVDIYEDINVVFGEKGSGKTILMKNHILPYFQSQGKRVFLHEGKNYEDEFNKIVDRHKKSVEIDEELKTDVEDNFNKVIEYSEGKPNNFIKKSIEYNEKEKSSKNAQMIHKTDSVFSETDSNSFDELYDEMSKNTKKISGVQAINNDFRDTNDENRKGLNHELLKLSNEFTEQLKVDYKKLFIRESTEFFLDSLKDSVKKKTGKKPKLSKIGFADLVTKRLSYMDSIEIIKKSLSLLSTEETHRLGILPNKGEVQLKTQIVVLTSKTIHIKDSVFDKNKIRLNRSLIEHIYNFSFSDFSEVNSYFDTDEKNVSGNVFTNDVIKKETRFKIKGNNAYRPSEGEKAILSISGLLEDYKFDCYLFDEIERGLGNKYISEYLIPQLNQLRGQNKTIVLSTHNANIAINTLPSQCIYCDYEVNKANGNTYYFGNMYSNELEGALDNSEVLNWEEKALEHLEGSQEMFNRRKNIYGI